MKVLSLYVENDTPVHKLAPSTKLWYAFSSVIIAFLFSSLWIGAVLLSISLLLSLVAKVFRHMLKLIGAVLIVSLTMLFIQGMYYQGNETLVFSLWKFHFYKEGLIHALLLILRVFNMIVSFGILILTTKPSDLVTDLVQNGLSPRFGYVLSSVLQVIPQMISTSYTIIDAQKSRGLDTEGSVLKKLRAFFALIGPLVLSSLVEARERAVAIELRGFSIEGTRTFVNPVVESHADRWIKMFTKTLVIFAIAWRGLLWIIQR
ncbi:MAG: energy-coupling factor transporter transmembrane component T [Fervidobacterium sp.]|uniref:Energy-coupling factor transport system permease protein n=1 Tax=Fervidobacterium gondwanense DSM 13020 TaxID=1121883 RepID=A0A1M7SS67_FERGO|nr:energy-coupling factor transporter transmembrane component T [Fervidobacterium gondwanense]UXF00583.1 cobalt ABC transporter permease [Fervidobacterium riparium]SHN61319.1 energy-coupling factor transport system permease protein [Fervidobacterium gondwanense DSM 13020]